MVMWVAENHVSRGQPHPYPKGGTRRPPNFFGTPYMVWARATKCGMVAHVGRGRVFCGVRHVPVQTGMVPSNSHKFLVPPVYAHTA